MQRFNVIFRVYLSIYLPMYYKSIVMFSCCLHVTLRNSRVLFTSRFREESWRVTCLCSASRRLQFTRRNGLAVRNARDPEFRGTERDETEHPSVLHLVIAATLLRSSVNRNGVGWATYRSWPQRQKL